MSRLCLFFCAEKYDLFFIKNTSNVHPIAYVHYAENDPHDEFQKII